MGWEFDNLSFLDIKSFFSEFDNGTNESEWLDNRIEVRKQEERPDLFFNSIDDTDLLSEPFGSDFSYQPPAQLTQLPNSSHFEYTNGKSQYQRHQDQPLGLNWLISECDKISLNNGIDSESLFSSIAMVLTRETESEEIQTELLDLIGYDSFDFLSELIANRFVLADLINNGVENNDLIEHTKQKRLKDLHNGTKPQYGSQVTIMLESEKKELKQYRKELKKQNKSNRENGGKGGSHLDPSELRRLREEALQQGPTKSNDSYNQVKEVKYPNIYQAAETSQGSLSMFGTKYHLPKGTVRESGEFYDEITIPITSKAPSRSTERSILISEMDSLCKESFKGYKSLNRVQSIVYPIAYQSNENMLLCAPTGAGKTDVAMLTVLRALYLHCTPTPDFDNFKQLKIQKSAFKVVYVAPMKALAAEIVIKLGSRLKWLGIQVRELTGDMQLTKTEILNTQIIVTTPEKWDVVTRKGTGDTELVQKLKLLIIDEVHLLHDDRGSVIESIVARTLRQVESTQNMIRIVGLSATLPNYLDVATFLKVNPYQGLFFFDGGFRPVPLEQHFLGVRGKPGSNASKLNLDRACYEKVEALLEEGHQVMIFVHTRKDTVKVAKTMIQMANENGARDLFSVKEENLETFEKHGKEVAKSRSGELRELYKNCVGVHHAGMLRSDRTLTEKMFGSGALRLLCCTATLAWGVNLPAFAVVIRGTQVYDAQKGSFIDLSILDVLQIFGRAGRPQYESHGVGYILTTGDKLSHYVSAITQQHPIESNFINNLVDNLCAEICLGTVTNVDEAVTWLSYTFLYVRMKKNPMIYGMNYDEAISDPLLGKKRRDLIVAAAKALQDNQMIVFDEPTGYMTPKDLGRIASLYYLSTNSVEIMNSKMKSRMGEANAFDMVSSSKEFENIKVRDGELVELKKLMNDAAACPVKDGVNSSADKVNVLMQAFISKAYPEDFALVSDLNYVAQNAGRILRAVFEIALNRNWGPTASVLLSLCKSLERQMWSFEHPLCQFQLPSDVKVKLENVGYQLTIEELRTMSPSELGDMIHFNRMGPVLAKCVDQFPMVHMDVSISPITRSVLRMHVTITADFEWNDRAHGHAEAWWLWVEDTNQMELYHSEKILLRKKGMDSPLVVNFTIPISEPLPNQIFVRAVSDRWIGSETLVPVSFQHLILPQLSPQHTNLLNLQPLPVSALKNSVLEDICLPRFTHFNPVQTQVFYPLYHQTQNILLGAPTGSGKTMAAELAMWATFRDHPNSKVVYVAPLKALVRERVADWRARLAKKMNKKLVELTGDITPDLKTIQSADIIITTPEKWDGISRGWQNRKYVRSVALVIIDEIHLLGGDRGPILEVIVSRMNYIASHTKRKVRIVGLSTALANAVDLAGWLGIDEMGLFNFRHSVRPVPLEVYIDGFSGTHYCPRMASMNRPTYKAIRTHSPNQPVIVFVSSRRQTRLTAKDLIAFCGLEENPRQFLHMSEEDVEMILSDIKDESLRNTLGFGIGLHHAGLTESDRKVVEELFVNSKIQVLIATSTLAWGVNFPAHLVVVKGTEYFDAKTKGYVDYPITDILQMMGRAGRPQFDTTGIARVFVQSNKKDFFKKFLHEPFPVESSLHLVLDDHFNAEIASGSIKNKQQAMDYLSWTYLYQRVRMNPTYYGALDGEERSIGKYLSGLIDHSLDELKVSGCIEDGEEYDIVPTKLGKISSYYYLGHQTIRMFKNRLNHSTTFEQVLRVLTDSHEYSEHPVRHNEDLVNQDLELLLPYSVSPNLYDSPHAKAFLLIQAHLARIQLPMPDYITDTGSILDQSVRILQAMADLSAYQGYLTTLLNIHSALQSILQGQFNTVTSLSMLPHCDDSKVQTKLANSNILSLAHLLHSSSNILTRLELNPNQMNQLTFVVDQLPKASIRINRSNPGQIDQLHPNQSHNIDLELNIERKKEYNGRTYTPRMAKPFEEVWWVILANPDTDEVITFKRVTVPPPSSTNLTNQRTKPKGKKGLFTTKLNIRLPFIAPSHANKFQYIITVSPEPYPGLEMGLEYKFCTV